MTFGDLKKKSMKDQPDKKSFGKKVKGTGDGLGI